MSYKSRARTSIQVTVGPANMKRFQDNSMLVYTVLTFFVVLAIYFLTKDWKGFTAPEEVDLGVVSVPAHGCRRKHRHHEH